jgi:transposase
MARPIAVVEVTASERQELQRRLHAPTVSKQDSLRAAIILRRYGTNKEVSVRKWLSRHPRFHLHFTPTSSSWLNLVERFFGELTADVVRGGSFGSVRQLVHDIETYLVQRNVAPQPYRWKAQGEEILRRIARAREALAAEQTRSR